MYCVIYVTKFILNRGAVALDGRIEPGDMILQVNDINFENMSNDEAVRVLREVVQKPGYVPITYVHNCTYNAVYNVKSFLLSFFVDQ